MHFHIESWLNAYFYSIKFNIESYYTVRKSSCLSIIL